MHIISNLFTSVECTRNTKVEKVIFKNILTTVLTKMLQRVKGTHVVTNRHSRQNILKAKFSNTYLNLGIYSHYTVLFTFLLLIYIYLLFLCLPKLLST